MLVLMAPAMRGMSDADKQGLIGAMCEEAANATGEPRAGDQTVPHGKARLVHETGVATGVPDMAGVRRWQGMLGVSREGLEKAKDDWYALRGWDLETGIPFQATLRARGLADVADDLPARGLAV